MKPPIKWILAGWQLALTSCIICMNSQGQEPGNGYLGMSLPNTFRLFAPSSPWNMPIEDNPALDDHSNRMIQHLNKKALQLHTSTRKWTIPLFVIDSSLCPRVNVTSTNGPLYHSIDPDKNSIAENIPIPAGVWPDPKSDAHMVLIDPKRQRSWDFAGARHHPDGTWTANTVDTWDLCGPGYRQPFQGRHWWRSGAMGAGMPLAAGLIRPEEIAAGEIRHALLCATPINRKTSYPTGPLQLCSPPASRSDGHGIGIMFIPEGARLQLDPELDLDSLPLSQASKTVARAMQKYGMFVGMNAKTFKVFFQNLGPEATPWQKHDHFKDLAHIPLDRFRILKCNLVQR